jgi:hypothetical protein
MYAELFEEKEYSVDEDTKNRLPSKSISPIWILILES